MGLRTKTGAGMTDQKPNSKAIVAVVCIVLIAVGVVVLGRPSGSYVLKSAVKAPQVAQTSSGDTKPKATNEIERKIESLRVRTGEYGRILRRRVNTPCPARAIPKEWETVTCGGVLSLEAYLPTVGLSVVSYNHRAFTATTEGALGYAWELGIDHEIHKGVGFFEIQYPGGHLERYSDADGDGKFRADDKSVPGFITEVGTNALEFRDGGPSVRHYSRYGGRYLLDSVKRGATTTFTIERFGPNGRIDAIIDEQNVTISFAYTGTLLHTISNPVGGHYEFVYDPDTHNLIQIIWPDGRSYAFGYQKPYNVVTVFSAPDGSGSVIDYAQSVVQAIYPGSGGAETTFDYSARNKVKIYQGEKLVTSDFFTDGALTERHYGDRYDTFERYVGGVKDKLLWKYTSFTGHIAEYDYWDTQGKEGLLKRVKHYKAGATPNEITEAFYSYNAAARPEAVTTWAPNPDGERVQRAISLTYQNDDYLKRVTPAVGGGSEFVINRDPNNRILSVAEQLGGTLLQEVSYDPGSQRVVSAFDATTNSNVAFDYPDAATTVVAVEGEKVSISNQAGAVESVAQSVSGLTESYKYNEMYDVVESKVEFPNGGHVRTEGEIARGEFGSYTASNQSYYKSGQDCSDGACAASANFDLLTGTEGSAQLQSEYLAAGAGEQPQGNPGSVNQEVSPNAGGCGYTVTTQVQCPDCGGECTDSSCDKDPKPTASSSPAASFMPVPGPSAANY